MPVHAARLHGNAFFPKVVISSGSQPISRQKSDRANVWLQTRLQRPRVQDGVLRRFVRLLNLETLPPTFRFRIGESGGLLDTLLPARYVACSSIIVFWGG